MKYFGKQTDRDEKHSHQPFTSWRWGKLKTLQQNYLLFITMQITSLLWNWAILNWHLYLTKVCIGAEFIQLGSILNQWCLVETKRRATIHEAGIYKVIRGYEEAYWFAHGRTLRPSEKSIWSLQAHETDGLFKQISVTTAQFCFQLSPAVCVLEKQSLSARLTCEGKVQHAWRSLIPQAVR